MHGMEPSHQALVEREVLLERSPRSVRMAQGGGLQDSLTESGW